PELFPPAPLSVTTIAPPGSWVGSVELLARAPATTPATPRTPVTIQVVLLFAIIALPGTRLDRTAPAPRPGAASLRRRRVCSSPVPGSSRPRARAPRRPLGPRAPRGRKCRTVPRTTAWSDRRYGGRSLAADAVGRLCGREGSHRHLCDDMDLGD